ncbi:MAG: WD repeat-containing protein 33, partial [Marteilia pararefringens]
MSAPPQPQQPLNAQDIKNTTNFLLGSGAVGLAPQIIAGTVPLTSNLFDGKRLRKTVYRKTVDYTTFALNSQRDIWDSIDPKKSSNHKIQPHIIYSPEMGLPATFDDCPISSLPLRFVRQAQNKKRYPVNAIT